MGLEDAYTVRGGRRGPGAGRRPGRPRLRPGRPRDRRPRSCVTRVVRAVAAQARGGQRPGRRPACSWRRAAEELRQLARQVEARGLKASVASRFSDDPWAEVADLADQLRRRRRAGPQRLGRARGLDGHHAVAGRAAAARSSWSAASWASPGLSPRGPVSVVQDGDANGRAALRLAAQASMGRAVPLQLQAGDGRRAERRAAGVGDTLRRAGVAVAGEEEPGPCPRCWSPRPAAPSPAVRRAHARPRGARRHRRQRPGHGRDARRHQQRRRARLTPPRRDGARPRVGTGAVAVGGVDAIAVGGAAGIR